MKSPILFLPSLLLLGFAVVPWTQSSQPTSDVNASRHQEIQELRNELKKLSERLEELEAQTHHVLPRGGLSEVAPAAGALPPAPSAPELAAAVPTLPEADLSTLTFFRGISINFGVDGYYGYNCNSPVGRLNLLRAYIVTSENFNLNQSNLVSEHLPTAQHSSGAASTSSTVRRPKLRRARAPTTASPGLAATSFRHMALPCGGRFRAAAQLWESRGFRSATRVTTPKTKSPSPVPSASISCLLRHRLSYEL